MKLLDRLRRWASAVGKDTLTIWYAAKHPRTPTVAKVLAVCLVAYAFSPIDLIPDFIPVLGYLDDAILLPLGVLLIIRLIPDEVIAECRRRAAQHLASGGRRPVSSAGTVMVIVLWVLAAGVVTWTFAG
jgi:uncharacterized membrane protein YkvA (DUF1232 family)